MLQRCNDDDQNWIWTIIIWVFVTIMLFILLFTIACFFAVLIGKFLLWCPGAEPIISFFTEVDKFITNAIQEKWF